MPVALGSRRTRALLEELCLKYGFCLPQAETRRLSESRPSEDIGFTESVFLAEGLDPSTAPRHLYRKVLRHVRVAFESASENDGNDG